MAQRDDRRSEEAKRYRKLYHTKRWRHVRHRVLVRDLYQCQRCGCALVGVHPAPDSPTVNHIHLNDKMSDQTFYDEARLEAVCKECHDRDIQSEERGGSGKPVIGEDGWPVRLN